MIKLMSALLMINVSASASLPIVLKIEKTLDSYSVCTQAAFSNQVTCGAEKLSFIDARKEVDQLNKQIKNLNFDKPGTSPLVFSVRQIKEKKATLNDNEKACVLAQVSEVEEFMSNEAKKSGLKSIIEKIDLDFKTAEKSVKKEEKLTVSTQKTYGERAKLSVQFSYSQLNEKCSIVTKKQMIETLLSDNAKAESEKEIEQVGEYGLILEPAI